MLVDANLLIYAVDAVSPFHDRSAEWLTAQLNGGRRVALPWESLGAFLRISTNPRAAERPLSSDKAWATVLQWLALDVTWVPTATERHAEILGSLIREHQLRGNLIADAHLATLAIEHGLTLYSADTDFERFEELTWRNPLSRKP